MSEERWQRVEKLYHAALEHQSDERPAFLATACRSDEDLRREVEGLLKYDKQAAGFIETPALELEARALALDIAREAAPDSDGKTIPTQVGPYKLLTPLGTGGMGEVYLALDTRLNRKVAVKLLPAEFTSDDGRARRFKQEAQAASALNHPNIITVYEIGEAEGQPYIVTEYVDGETLRKLMEDASRKQLKVAEALKIAVQVAGALQAAHEAGIIHRDIKPENVMVRKDGLVKVLDFGLAKVRHSLSEPSLPTAERVSTQLGVIMGTVAYMSPEQARGEKVDKRADIFALGIILYEMLCGSKPFEGATASDVMAAVLTSEPPSLSERAPTVSPALRRIVRRSLEKQPEKRFQSVGDLAFALKELNGTAVSNPSAEAAPPQTGRATTWARLRRLVRGRLAWFALAVMAALLVAATIPLAIHWREQPEETLAVNFRITLPGNLGFRWFDTPAVSPDGKYIVYSASPISYQNKGEVSLWLRPLNSANAVQLPGTQGGFSPFWSPDSRFVAFIADGRLQKIDIAGGSAVTLCEAYDSLPGSWSRDGVILLTGKSRLSRVSAAGGQLTPLKLFADDETGQENPRFLSDGQHFLYASHNQNPQDDGVYVASLDSGAERKLILKGVGFAVYVPPGYLLFNRDNVLMAQRFDLKRLEVTGEPIRLAEQLATSTSQSSLASFAAFSVSENGVLVWKVQASQANKTQLTWFDRSGNRVGVAGEPSEFSGPALSPDEDRLAVAVLDPRTKSRDLWIMQPTRGLMSRLTFDPGDEINPLWTPDGKWIIFTSTQNGQRNIYRKLADGSGTVEPLLEGPETLNAEDISSDGRYLIFNYRLAEQSTPDQQSAPDLVVLSLGKDRRRTTFLATPGREDQARFSPNSRFVAYRSYESGRTEVYVGGFTPDGRNSGAKWQVSNDGGDTPEWRADGKELFYLKGNTLMAVEVNTSSASFSAGVPKPLFSLNIEADERRNRYIVTKDGQRFLVVLRAEGAVENTIAVQVNWLAALKQ